MLALPSSLTIDTVEKFTSDLAALVDADAANITLDASALEVITTPGIQVLLSLHKTLQQHGGALSITHLGDGPRSVCEQIGLAGIVHAWMQADIVTTDNQPTA